MDYPIFPSVDEIAEHLIASLQKARRVEEPWPAFLLQDVFPVSLCTAILTLPIAPPILGKTDGTRGSYNKYRAFFTQDLRSQFPVCEALYQVMQRPDVARQFEKTCNVKADGTYTRIEYIQDLDGVWLEPHPDTEDKIFSMVVYLFTGPEAKNWGTDLYDKDKKWFARANGEFNSAVIIKPCGYSWHGLEPRPIKGVRRLMELEYVCNWRDKEQLSSPEQPINLSGGCYAS